MTHVAAGYLIWKAGREPLRLPGGRSPSLAGISLFAFLSLLPDADAVLGILLHDLERFHNRFSHSLFSGLVLSLLLFPVARALGRPRPGLWMVYGLTCYWAHLLMDATTIGRGVMLFWPFSDTRFSSPVKLFTGLHWSAGVWSLRHMETFLTEGLLILSLLLLLAALGKRGLFQAAPHGKFPPPS